jgi:hypothetical protein
LTKPKDIDKMKNMDELFVRSKNNQEIVYIKDLLEQSNIKYSIMLYSKIPVKNFRYSAYDSTFENRIIIDEPIENYNQTLSENEYFEIYINKEDLSIAAKILNKNCVFSSTDYEKASITKKLLENNGYKIIKTSESINEFNEIEYSIFVDAECYDEITNFIERNNEYTLQNNEISIEPWHKNPNYYWNMMHTESKTIYIVLQALVIILFIIVYLIAKY